MGKTLVIVESPAKAKTINKYLGRDYLVKSSIGHIRDLPKGGGTRAPAARGARKGVSEAEKAAQARRALIRRMGVDPDNDWAADYQILPDKTKLLKELQEAAAKADRILLATDLDREGEAIAWHLQESIGGDPQRFDRVTFSEITKKAILEAFAHPGTINMDRVNAQQARRFLDRVVGFQVSPLLWKHVARGLSAGRVQSVTTRLVVERERAIHAFVPEEYWQIHADLQGASAETFRAEVVKQAGKTLSCKNEEAATAVQTALQTASYQIQAVEAKPQQQRPSAPLITSTLQQAASVRLGFSVRRTMTLAQRLYESGLITYMRTDSLNVSAEAVAACRQYIEQRFGQDQLPEQAHVYTSQASAQEAHEAIRPTEVSRSAEDLPQLESDQRRLYDLIHRFFVASQMPPARFDTTTVRIQAGDYELRARGRVLRHPGWMAILPPTRGDDREPRSLPKLDQGELLKLVQLHPTQHFTKPPARFTEASLVKEMERLGIGRPSTYGSIIATIQDRGYVRVESKRLYAEKTGEVVTDRLCESFPHFMDYGFTAAMEEQLDQVALGKEGWKDVLNRFYKDFTAALTAADQHMRPNNPTMTDIDCPTCGRKMMVRTGQTGVFLGCSGYNLPPKERCVTTMNLSPGEEAVAADAFDEDASAQGEAAALRAKRRCPLCGTAMDSYLVDEQRKLHVCGNNPDCPGFIVEEGHFRLKGYDGPSLECDKCGSPMHLKNGRFGKYFDCTNKDCGNTRKLLRNGQPAPPKADPVPMPELRCERSDAHFVLRDGAAGIFLAASNYPRSRETRNPLVRELLPHKEELDPKHRYLAEAPQQDPQGNPAIIRWSRKNKCQYVSSEQQGKATDWTAHYVNGRWEERQGKQQDAST